MKNLKEKIVPAIMKLVPVCAAMMLVINANSTASIINGQPEVPASAKKYRKF